jgi:hypothetical protein
MNFIRLPDGSGGELWLNIPEFRKLLPRGDVIMNNGEKLGVHSAAASMLQQALNAFGN